MKFNSPINLSFFGYPHNERSTYIKDFNCSRGTKSSYSRAAIFTFLFIYSKKISSLVFVGFVGASCYLGEDVNTVTSSFIISTRLLLLHFRILISSSSLLLPIIYSFIISMWLFLLHLRILISSTSLMLPFTSSSII